MASASDCPYPERRELEMHHVPMFNCGLCSYQACRPCAAGLLARLAEAPDGHNGNGTNGDTAAAIDVDREDERCRVQARIAARDGATCPLCSKGKWELVPVPYFRWKCEGPTPRWRFKDGIISMRTVRNNCAFELQALQQHHEKKAADSNRSRHVAVRRAWFVAMVPQDPDAARRVTAASAHAAYAASPHKLATSAAGSVAQSAVSSSALRPFANSKPMKPLRHGTRRRTAAARLGLLHQESSTSSSSSSASSSDAGAEDPDVVVDERTPGTTRSRRSGDANLASRTPVGDATKSLSPLNHIAAASPTAMAPPSAPPAPPRAATWSPLLPLSDAMVLPPAEYHEASRGPSCVEGRKFIFRVANTGAPVNMFWVAVTDTATAERDTLGLAKHTETCIPISGFVCPTTDSSTGSTLDPVSVPMVCDLAQLGVLGRYFVRRLALYEGPPMAEANGAEGYEGFGPCRPLLVVSVLCNVSILRHVSLLSPLDTVIGRQLHRAASQAGFAWATALETAAESLLSGRCVAFYGVGGKRHLLDFISDAAELSHSALHVLDPWALGASPLALGAATQQPAAAAKAFSAALERMVANMMRYDQAALDGAVKSAAAQSSMPHMSTTTTVRDSRSPPQPVYALPPPEVSLTQPLNVLSLNVGPTQAPCTASTAALSGAGDLFDLGPTTPLVGIFDVTCADHAAARAVVSRAVNGTAVRRRVTSLLTDHAALDEPRSLRHLIVVPNIDALDDATVSKLARLHEQRRETVTIVASFDSPNFPTTCVAAEAFGFQLIHVQTLMPYARDGLSRVAVAQLESFVADAARARPSAASEGAAAATAAGGGTGGSRGRAGATNLPMRDTVTRSLLSVPQAFRNVLKHILARQREVGDDVLMGVNALIDHLAQRHQLYLATSRMSGIIRELKSNRIILYDGRVHAIKVLQLRLVEEVLEEVNEATANAQGGIPLVGK